MRNKKGITLIALIITIIVMLILVGVTINVAINGGLFDIAKNAEKKQTRAMLKEELTIVEATMDADVIGNSDKYVFKSNEQEEIYAFMKTSLEEIESNGFKVDEQYITNVGVGSNGETDSRGLDWEKLVNSGLFTSKLEGSFDIDNINGLIVPCKYKEEELEVIVEISIGDNVTISGFKVELGDDINIKLVTDTVDYTVGGNIKEVRNGVPIPKGFYYVTGTKNEGVVISDNSADEDNAIGNNGNQFVWVPVGRNPRIEIDIQEEQKIDTIRILNMYGYDETIPVNSEFFSKTIPVTDNIIYEVVINYADGTKMDKLVLTDNCYAPLADTGMVKTLVSMALIDITDETVNTLFDYLQSEYKKEHPDVIFETRIDYLREIGMVATTDELNNLDNPSEKESVLKYGGFYIGRYEVSSLGVIKNIQPKYMTFSDASSEVENFYADSTKYGVKAKIPTKTSWGRIGTWLLETKNKNGYQIYMYSMDWGNFGGPVNNAELKGTGSNQKYVANNMYDLAGNAKEWTYSTNSNNEITTYESGGGYVDAGGCFASINEVKDTTTEGVRPMLYFYDE